MNTKLKIISELEKNHKGIHLRGISRLVDSGLPNVRRFLIGLEKEGVVKKEKEANLTVFKIRENEKTIAYLKQINTERFLALPGRVQDAINEFLEDLESKPLIMLIFGSYAKGNYNRESDIDILLVFQKIENNKSVDITAKRIGMRTNTKINPAYVNYNNFEKNFLDKNHDFSREIRQEIILKLGIEYYYNLLWRFLK